MAATNNKIEYAAQSTLTATGWASLASDTNLLAGYSLAEIDNGTVKYLDYEIAGHVRTGTTPTAATRFEIWLIPEKTDTPAYFDTFDGTAKAVTVTTRDMLFTYGRLAVSCAVTATSNVDYHYWTSVAALFGGVCPRRFQLWLVHNTAVALNATTTNFSAYAKGVYSTSGG